MKRSNIIISVFILLSAFCTISAQNDVLEKYIQFGLENNLALRQKQYDYEISLKSLKSAASYFYPNISVNARYTVAQGGRTIDFPVGDLLNPVYSTLNQLLQSEQFPMLDNIEFQFYRPQEQETKLTLVQPIVNPAILYNYQIEKVRTRAAATDINIYKRELVFQIKTAYYNYLKTLNLKKLVDETTTLVEENLRVSKSLFNNGKVTSDVIFRSEAELQQIKVKNAEAEKARAVAMAYFNFLINKPLTDTIEVFDAKIASVLSDNFDINQEITSGLATREELQQLDLYKSITRKYIDLARSSNFPNVFLATSYGIQGVNYSFTRDDDFLLASVVLQWNLFEGLRNQASVQKAKIAMHQVELKSKETEKQIELQIINSYYDLLAANESVEASSLQAEASAKAFNVVREKYKNGQAHLIEYIDARTSMTVSKENMIIAWYDFKIKEAAFERMTAQENLNDNYDKNHQDE